MPRRRSRAPRCCAAPLRAGAARAAARRHFSAPHEESQLGRDRAAQVLALQVPTRSGIDVGTSGRIPVQRAGPGSAHSESLGYRSSRTSAYVPSHTRGSFEQMVPPIAAESLVPSSKSSRGSWRTDGHCPSARARMSARSVASQLSAGPRRGAFRRGEPKTPGRLYDGRTREQRPQLRANLVIGMKCY